MLKGKPTVFISHVHGEQHTANAIEDVIRKCLLGSINVFNSSNRQSLSPGDPWRDTIVDTLKGSASVLVVASPDSVASPWVNFEAGGAWLSGVRVVPCCVKGMKPSSLPAPLGHLQAVSLDTVGGLADLIRQIAEVAGLDYPSAYDFDAGLQSIVSTWKSVVSDTQNEELIKWFGEAERRPNKHAGTSATGFFRIKNIRATEPRETKQVTKYKLVAGDSLKCLIRVEGDQIGYR